MEILQGCVDYITILASQMLLIYQNNTSIRFFVCHDQKVVKKVLCVE